MRDAELRTRSGLDRGWVVRVLVLSAFCLLPSLPGCHSASRDPQAGLNATQAADETATFAYWMKKPPVASADSADFDALWRACRRVTSGASYTIDRVDARGGRMTSLPLVSKQVFELWRNDVATVMDQTESTLSTVRRTVLWNVDKMPEGTFRATPKVVVERYVMGERRLTSAMQYQEVFSDTHKIEGRRFGDDTTYDGPDIYWYATGRDTALEKRLAATVASLLKG